MPAAPSPKLVSGVKKMRGKTTFDFFFTVSKVSACAFKLVEKLMESMRIKTTNNFENIFTYILNIHSPLRNEK